MRGRWYVARWFGVLLVVLLGLVALGTGRVQAAGVVTNCADSGAGSLRQAIIGGGTVTFTAGLNCTSAGTGPILLTSGPLTLTANTTIDGTGATIAVDGNNSSSVFTLSGAITVSISRLTVTGGNASEGGGFSINAAGPTLNLTSVTVSNSTATVGGGIFSRATVNVTSSLISGNTGTNAGGGIYAEGTLHVTDSTFSGNNSSQGGAMNPTGAATTVDRSTFTGNTDGSRTGGIWQEGGSMTVSNSTFSGDTGGATSEITAISSATLTVTNSTIAGGTATFNSGIASVNGSTVTVTNTILAGAGNQCKLAGGTIVSGGHNLDLGSSCGLTGTGDLQNVAAVLGTLGTYGSANGTQTLPLLPGSRAIDAGDDTVCGATPVSGLDQRGVSRTVHGTHCDIGAFESQGFTFSNPTGSGQSTTVNTAFAAPLGITVTATAPIEPVNGGQVTFTVTPASGAQATFGTLAGCSLSNGNLTAACTIASGTAVSPTLTANGTAGSYSATATASGVPTTPTYTLTNLLPTATVVSIARVGTTPTNASSVSWTVTFSTAVSGVKSDGSNFSLTVSGLGGTPTVGTPTTSDGGTTWTVPASTGTGSGTIRLDMANATGLNHTITNLPFTGGQSFTIDRVAPTVQSINTSGTNPTNAASVSWSVTFSKPVSGLANGNFTLTVSGLGGTPAVTGTTPSGSTPTDTWTVTASTGTGSGTVRLNMATTTGVSDSVGNAVSGLPFTGGQSFTIDRTAPTVQSIALAGASPTNAASVSWTVTFSKAVSGVVAGSFTLVPSGLSGTPAVSTPTTSDGGTTWTVPASTGSGSGTLGLNVTDGTGVTDSVGNALTGLPATGAVYTLDRTAPTVQSITHLGPSPTNAASVSWTVTFSKPVTGVASGNFTPAVTGLGGTPAVTGTTPTGSTPTATWTVTVSTGSGSGTLGVNMTNSTNAHDAAGNAVSGLTATGDTVSVDLVAPTVQSIALVGTSPTNATSVSWTVTFTKPVSGLASGNFTLAITSLGGTPAITTVTPTGTAPTATWTVSASTGTKTGTLGLNMTSSGGVNDSVGNAVTGLPATGALFTIDRTPTIATITPASGPATLTKTITITGAKFQAGATVSFGGGAGTGITVSPDGTTITVTTPIHSPGSVDVVVTNPDTLTATKTGGYTFVPPPRVDYLSLNSGSTTGGDPYDISGANFQPGVTVTFAGVPAERVDFVTSTAVHAVTPPHAAGIVTVDMVVTNPDGQRATLTQQFTFGPVSGGAPPNRSGGAPPTGEPVAPLPSGPPAVPGNGGPPQQIPNPRPNQ